MPRAFGKGPAVGIVVRTGDGITSAFDETVVWTGREKLIHPVKISAKNMRQKVLMVKKIFILFSAHIGCAWISAGSSRLRSISDTC